MLMKSVALLFSMFSFTTVLAHGNEESRVSVESEIQGNLTAGKIDYSFQLFDTENQKTIQDTDLTETHTKILHMIVFDSSLNEFNHVHPEFNGTVWNTQFNLPRNGVYFVWAQGMLKDGTEFSSYAKAQVIGGEAELTPVNLGDHRKNSDRSTVIELDSTKLRAGKMTMMNFKATRDDGKVPLITPYLGAMAHVIAASPDGDELIHVHPMEGGQPNTGMVHATFPTEGDYRIWIQLIDNGELKTIPLSVTVLK